MGPRVLIRCVAAALAVSDAGADASDACEAGGTASSRACESETRGGVLLQRSTAHVAPVSLVDDESGTHLGIAGKSASCDEASWPDKDHGLVCGECKVLVDQFSSRYKTCGGYCAAVGRQCVAAWEEVGDTCDAAYSMTCDQTLASSDAICQCGDELATTPSEGIEECYASLPALAVDEGQGVGAYETQSIAECKNACDGNDRCKSFSFCSEWHGCWMKDGMFEGGEPTRVVSDCKTYYKKACDAASPRVTAASPATTVAPVPSSSPVTIKIASYNLFWWNAFRNNPWKGTQVTNNIKDKLQADVIGLQECDDPDLIEQRTGYSAASPFEGAQGLVVLPARFTVLSSGSRSIRAKGKWGTRYVTWAQLKHKASGRSFWHFNTHWCVHSGNGHTCNADKRLQGARNMLAIIRDVAGKDTPIVVTGDFNAAMGEPGPKLFLQSGFSLAETSWVDAIFYSTGHWRKAWSGSGDSAMSDHRPVIADMELIVG